MYTVILPILASKGAIAVGGEVWLPHIPCIAERLCRLWSSLASRFSKHFIADTSRNPLFVASHNVEAQILAKGDRFTNGSALISLDKKFPFIVLRCINSGDQLQTNQKPGCGSLVSELKPHSNRQLRFKLPATDTNNNAILYKTQLETSLIQTLLTVGVPFIELASYLFSYLKFFPCQ